VLDVLLGLHSLYSTVVRKAIFLDRDGTIIDNQGDLGDPKGVNIIDGAKEAIKSLADAGWLLIVITNQAGVARGVFTEQDIHAVHEYIDTLVGPIEKYYYCCFHEEGVLEEWRGNHPWRKPAPGMLLQAIQDFEIDASSSWMIGDTARDIQAGQAAGCKTIWLTQPGRMTDEVVPTLSCPTLAEAAPFILATETIS
jgi:D-glycero-D-manno-heptose 1,7-bisphosphate phosphatase|tara:strand:- start:3413 stop:4000 length:588 start_codon:yes stop_codon:yes gene_type:complete